MEAIPKWFRIMCYLSVLGSSYLASLNFSSYYNANEADKMREEVSREIEIRFSNLGNVSEEEGDRMFEMVQSDIETNLTVPKYKKHSLFRIIGNLATMLGALLMLRLKRFGYHLYVAGTLFLVFTGFAAIGLGIIGWTFNLFYIFTGIGFTIFYSYNRKLLV